MRRTAETILQKQSNNQSSKVASNITHKENKEDVVQEHDKKQKVGSDLKYPRNKLAMLGVRKKICLLRSEQQECQCLLNNDFAYSIM